MIMKDAKYLLMGDKSFAKRELVHTINPGFDGPILVSRVKGRLPLPL